MAAIEVMIATGAIRNLIREGKTHQIPTLILSGQREGMQTLNQALRVLVEQRQVTYDDAASHTPNERELAQLLGRPVSA